MDNKGKSVWYVSYSYIYKNDTHRSQSSDLLIAEDVETAIHLVKANTQDLKDVKIFSINHRGILTL